MLSPLHQTSLGIFCCNVPGFEVGLRVLSRFSIVTCFPTGIIAVRVLEKSGDISGRRSREGNPGAGSSSRLRYINLMDGCAESLAGRDNHMLFNKDRQDKNISNPK